MFIKVGNIVLSNSVMQRAKTAQAGDVFIVSSETLDPLVYMLVVNGDEGVLVSLHDINSILKDLSFKPAERYYWFDVQEIKKSIAQKLNLKIYDVDSEIFHLPKELFEIHFYRMRKYDNL